MYIGILLANPKSSGTHTKTSVLYALIALPTEILENAPRLRDIEQLLDFKKYLILTLLHTRHPERSKNKALDSTKKIL